MADSIKIGNLDISAFKVGTSDCKIFLGTTQLYPQGTPPTHDYSLDYMTIRSTSDNNEISWSNSGYTSSDFVAKTISYSIDSGLTWDEVTSQYGITTRLAYLNDGDTLLLKGEEQNYSVSNKKFHYINADNSCDLEGNIMSMAYGDNFIGQYNISYDAQFRCLFSKCVGLRNLTNLVLPATSLSNNCYQSLFDGSGVVSANFVLPATSLINNCYRAMFANCSSLESVNSQMLPSTEVPYYGYAYMFQNCTSLTAAPQLPATTLGTYCYYYMFASCTSLTETPQLLATTLTSACYGYMFNRCSNLNSITCLATNIGAANCTLYWVKDIAASGTFTKAASVTSWKSGSSGIPLGWTVVDV